MVCRRGFIAPPDLLVQAVRLADDSYRLESRVQKQMIPRPDVAQHYATRKSLLCGWEHAHPLDLGVQPNNTVFLGLRSTDSAAGLCPNGI